MKELLYTCTSAVHAPCVGYSTLHNSAQHGRVFLTTGLDWTVYYCMARNFHTPKLLLIGHWKRFTKIFHSLMIAKPHPHHTRSVVSVESAVMITSEFCVEAMVHGYHIGVCWRILKSCLDVGRELDMKQPRFPSPTVCQSVPNHVPRPSVSVFVASFFATTDSKPQRRDSVLVHMFHSVLKCSLQRSYKTHFNSHTESHTLIIVHENQPNTTEKLRILIISLFAL